MWIMMNDCFLSIVKKDCPEGSLLVRARRPGDIEKVFGRRIRVDRVTQADYLFRAVIPADDVVRALQNEVLRINYTNFKSSVVDDELHDAYMSVWSAMAATQNPRPYSGAMHFASSYGNHVSAKDVDKFVAADPAKAKGKRNKKGKSMVQKA